MNRTEADIRARVAGAPISWGVSEVPGWGHQMRPDRVLREMSEVGLAATELGPAGFLPGDPAEAARLLSSHGLSAVGGFLPVVLFDPDHDPLVPVEAALHQFDAAGARTLVLAAANGLDGYDERPQLEPAQWRLLLDNLHRIRDLAAEQAVSATLHPHVGTLVEQAAEVERVLEDSDIGLCLDTGHLLVGGTDPVELAATVPGRVTHAHLKDVDRALAEDVRAGRLPFTEAVRRGLFQPLGRGDVDIAALVRSLEAAGYDGWYVMEQDVVLDAEPAPGAGPVTDVQASYEFLAQVAR